MKIINGVLSENLTLPLIASGKLGKQIFLRSCFRCDIKGFTMKRQMMKFLIAATLLIGLAGCVERTLTITSEPTDALVYISSEEIGRTPVTKSFTWYGDYEIILRKDGYETLKTHYKINPPLYEIPPLDLLSALAPWTYHDNRTVHFVLEKKSIPSDAELIQRAEQLRKRNAEEPSR